MIKPFQPCLAILAGMLSFALQAADSTNKPVSVFADTRLEAAVRQQVFAKRGTQEPLTAADVGNVSTVSAPFAGITNLAGLEHCRSLAMLELPGNRIADLRPLSGLKQLQMLNLASNVVRNLAPLAEAPALQYVELSNNQVSDVAPLGQLPQLASVYLGRNRLASVAALTHCPRLTTVYLDDNKIASLAGFEVLKAMTTFSAARNRIADPAPVAGFRAPFSVNLSGNKVRKVDALETWLAPDLAGPRAFAPFVRIQLDGNPLSRVAKKQVESLNSRGARIQLAPAK